MKHFYLFFRIFFLLPIFLYSQHLLAQQSPAGNTPIPEDSIWVYDGSVAVNFSQVSLNNWAGGGQSSVAAGTIITLGATYTKGKSLWENRLDVAYGLMRQGDDEQDEFRKTDDLFNVVSKYNYRIDNHIYITALTDFLTQLNTGYEYIETNGEVDRNVISDFLAPGFLVSSIGATYKEGKTFSLTLSPLTSKLTFVLNDSLSNVGAFGIEPGGSVRSEFGAALRTQYEKEVYNNINFRTSLNLFSNYGDFAHTDVNWEGLLSLKVNEFIQSTIAAQLIYDHDVIQKTQWRNAINVGFLLTL
ncbi:DUF3078 domain-containing protein [Nafulsella turpanensis]|uniref:DUF3078 domain-containing protein n=1 Tax=Nafulsella turpanensis TaxID=1265690 RepID=UPI00034949B7|nr:DUF3078 domain-containing protein [Nafulsella turpanensis]